MRVDEHSLTDQVSSTASRAAESQRIQVDTGTSSGASGAGAADRVDLSGLAGRISQTMQTLASQSAQRVDQLQKDFRRAATSPTRSRSPAPWRGPDNMPEHDLQRLLTAAQARVRDAHAPCWRGRAPAVWTSASRCYARHTVIWSGCATAFRAPG